MPKSLRAKLSKLRHDEHITDAECQELKKKLDGHDREFRKMAIDEFSHALKERFNVRIPLNYRSTMQYFTLEGAREIVDEVAEEMKSS